MKRTLFVLFLVVGLTSCTKKETPPERTAINVPPPMVPEHEIVPEEPEKVDRTFEGKWNTNRSRLNGIMNCTVTPNGDCRFWGNWQGTDFEYNVKFDGPDENLKGRPKGIDGVVYQWSGSIKDGVFSGNFTSNGQHNGNFSLKEKL